MNLIIRTGLIRSTSKVLLAGALALAVAACGSTTEQATLENIGLAVSADVQQGATLELAVPMIAGTTISVATAPTGVAAAIEETANGLLLTIDVEPDTPSGSYNLGLNVTRNGSEQLLGWPFDVVAADEAVVDPAGTQYASPEAIRDALVEGLLLGDPTLVEPLWPADSWAGWGNTLVGEFVPSAENANCERMGDSTAHCFVFAENDPFVLSITMERQGLDMWTITAMAYDSTN